MKQMQSFIILLLFMILPLSGMAEIKLKAARVEQLPVLDGIGNDTVWKQSKAVTIRDAVANINMEITAVHDGTAVAIMVQYPDQTENRSHRSLMWNSELKSYQNGPQREDLLILKWSMVPYQSGLTLKEDRPYTADIWFWKAHRTDHAGYADDKIHFYTTTREPKAQLLVSDSGRVFYLVRKGDKGTPAYMPRLYGTFIENMMPKYRFITPTDSRADVRAKGNWQNNRWTIEFSRKLQTGNGDDIQFTVGNAYKFGISRYEIAGRQPNPKSEQPLYGAGDVGNLLVLELTP